MRSIAALAFMLAGLTGIVQANPSPQTEGDLPTTHIAFSYANNTVGDLIPVADSLDVQEINSGSPAVSVFVSPPYDGTGYITVRCTFLEPNRQGLGVVQPSHPLTTVIDPPAVVGFVQCNSA